MSGSIFNGLGPWADGLQDASWRGIPFAVKSSTVRRGRRVALHEYPLRDQVWVEDLGRGTRVVAFTGFLIGDDVFDQRDAMLEACEEDGPGELVHPSLGTIQAALMEFSAGERAELGRVVEIEFSFVETEQDEALYPSNDISTQGQVDDFADAADQAAGSDFIADTLSAVAFGEAVIVAGVATVTAWAGLAASVILDAALVADAVTGLAGNNGRYGNGGRAVLQPAGTTATSALLALTAARTAVTAAAAVAVAATPTAAPAACQALAEAVRATAGDPADQIRITAGLAAFQPVVPSAGAPIGAAIVTMTVSTGALCRRAGLTSLARASASYQPTSFDDAISQLLGITAAFDAEIVVAADAGDTASYVAFRALRTAISNDLITRGAKLPRLIAIRRGASLPSLTVAYQLYADATRSDELIARADPIHPLFMPHTFPALAS